MRRGSDIRKASENLLLGLSEYGKTNKLPKAVQILIENVKMSIAIEDSQIALDLEGMLSDYNGKFH